MNNINSVSNYRIESMNPVKLGYGVSKTEVDAKANEVKIEKEVISSSEHGDEFIRTSIARTDDGVVFKKPEDASVKAQVRVPEGEELPEIDSLVGFTTAQVERFYYEGRISRHDFDVKMEEFDARLKEAVGNEDDKSGDAKREMVASEEAKTSERKEDFKDEGVKASSEKEVQKDNSVRTEVKKDMISDASERVEDFNIKMTYAMNAVQEEKIIKIIDSGKDPMATLEAVRGTQGSGMEGRTWSLALEA